MCRNEILKALGTAAACVLWLGWGLEAAAHHEHHGPTYEVTEPIPIPPGEKMLTLKVIDADTGEPTAARFSLVVDGREHTPAGLGQGGLRFVSIHTGKRQRFVATYARGSGDVEIPLPAGARRGVVSVVKGFDYLPEEIAFEVAGQTAQVTVTLERWNDLQSEGWLSAEEHLHYDRLDPGDDADWLTILAAEDLAAGHFLVLKGGNLAGIWATQYAYGPAGEAFDGRRLIRPGEEFRDGLQGHINLLGVEQVIEPISTGRGDHPFNYPTFFDVFQRARQLGGIGGPAHGTALGRSPTGIADTLLGAVDFFEIANTHLYKTDVWYRLMNCGYVVPPAAGTDLPNNPFRDRWQPLLGETRMVVHVGGRRDFESWKEAVRRGEVFVSSGPTIQFTVQGAGPGGTIRLPAGGGEVLVEAELAGPRELESLEVVHNSKPVTAEIRRQKQGRVHRLRLSKRLRVTESGWLAARGVGVPKRALEQQTGIRQKTFAHTAAVRVLVGDEPITSAEDASLMLDHLHTQRETYRTKAKYARDEDRARALELFDRAIAEITRQAGRDKSPTP